MPLVTVKELLDKAEKEIMQWGPLTATIWK